MDSRTKNAVSPRAQLFTRDQVLRLDFGSLPVTFAPEALTADTLRRSYDSLVIRWAGFEGDRRALFQIPEIRVSCESLHQVWPHAFFFCRIPESDLKTLVYSRVSDATSAQDPRPREAMVSRNELFQIVCRDFEPLEQACLRANLGPSVFRTRARQILKIFGYLKK